MHRIPVQSTLKRELQRGHLGWTLALLAIGGALIGCQPGQESRTGSVPTPPLAVTDTVGESLDPASRAAGDPNQPLAPASAPASTAVSSEIRRVPNQPPRRKPDEVHRITFNDLEINMQEDMVFDPAQLTDRVRELDGQRVRVKGFISPGIFQQSGIDRFPLVMNTECKFGPGGQADHVIIVDLLGGLTTSFTVRPIAVEGRLSLQPWNGPDGNTWALYHLAGEKVE